MARTRCFRPLLSLCLLAVLALAAAPLAARDNIEFARYLATRLRMYDEAKAMLDDAIKAAPDAQKVRARQYKAEVMKSEADYRHALDGDDDARLAMYKLAVSEFGEATTPEGVLAKAQLQLDVARALQRVAPLEAREQTGRALVILKDKRDELEKLRDTNRDAWRANYDMFSKIGFTYCVGFYVMALTHEMGSEEREQFLVKCDNEIGEFQFSLESTTAETVLSYELFGDMELARNRPEIAVSKFIDLVKFLREYPADASIGRLALANGYLRAAEVLTTTLDYDTRYLEQAIRLHTEAFARYGTLRDLDYQFKSFELYRVSAQIKLGNPEMIQGAVNSLLQLSQDRDGAFRRQAMTVLADIALRDSLTLDLRFRCASAAARDIETLPVSVMLRLAQAYQAMLASCTDLQSFESYAPACFDRAGYIYTRMWRFLDAAMVYREAATRTAYFQSKFSEERPVPAHMLDRTPRIVDGKTLMSFPGDMATEYQRCARFLVDAKIGEPGNRTYEQILAHANQVRAELGGRSAQLDLAYSEAQRRATEGATVQAAVRFINLPADYRRYHLALSQAGGIYYNLAYDRNSQRISGSGSAEERESEELFTQQRDRHATDLASLPAGMIAGHAAHWDVVLERQTPGPLANWHKAVYLLKKYLLVEARRHWPEIEAAIAEMENPTYLDGLYEIARVRNARWMRDNPTGSGEADADMRRIGIAAFYLAWLMRNPPDGMQAAAREALLATNRVDALRVLSGFWQAFGRHLEGRDEFRQGALRLAFEALLEAREADRAEAAYLAYVEAFPKDERWIPSMVGRLYTLITEQLQPRANAMQFFSAGMRSRANQLKRGLFRAINESQFAADAKQLAEAKAEAEIQRVLASHFWNQWIVRALYEDATHGAVIKAQLADVAEALQKQWEAMAAGGVDRWADAVKAELDEQLKSDTHKAIVDTVRKAMEGATKYELFDRLRGLRDTVEGSEDVRQGVATLYSQVEIATQPLRYFTGTVFIYEFASALETLAADLDERSRPLTTRILKYYEEARVRSGRAGEGQSQELLLTLGRQYFRIRDWNATVRYLDEYLSRFGTERDYGTEREIAVDTREKRVGRARSGEELEVKYRLGRAFLERYKQSSNVEDLKRAALLMRRCWCFNMVRDANEISKLGYVLNYQSQIEEFYLAVGTSMAEIFRLIHAAPEEIQIEWPKYANQYTRTLEVDKDQPLQRVPADRAGALWEAREIHMRIWTSYSREDNFQYRSEFRNALLAWVELSTVWVNAYGNKDMGIAELKGAGAGTKASEVARAAGNYSNLPAAYQTDETRAYTARLKQLGEEFEAACRKAGITLAQ